jgi:hypothetical protein
VRVLERIAVGVVSLGLAIGIIVVLSGGPLAGRDHPTVSGDPNLVGVSYRDQGDRILASGVPHPAYDSSPPTSGPHASASVHSDDSLLSDDQLLQALSTGNIVFLYGTLQPPSALVAQADAVTAPFSPALARAGQAVILARRPGTQGIVAVAWTRLLRVSQAQDPRLRTFAAYWLGRGAGK